MSHGLNHDRMAVDLWWIASLAFSFSQTEKFELVKLGSLLDNTSIEFPGYGLVSFLLVPVRPIVSLTHLPLSSVHYLIFPARNLHFSKIVLDAVEPPFPRPVLPLFSHRLPGQYNFGHFFSVQPLYMSQPSLSATMVATMVIFGSLIQVF